MITQRQLSKTKRHPNRTIIDANDLLNGTAEVNKINVDILMENYMKELEKILKHYQRMKKTKKTTKTLRWKKNGY